MAGPSLLGSSFFYSYEETRRIPCHELLRSNSEGTPRNTEGSIIPESLIYSAIRGFFMSVTYHKIL